VEKHPIIVPDAGASHPAQARYQNRLESGREAGPGRRRTSGIIPRPGSEPEGREGTGRGNNVGNDGDGMPRYAGYRAELRSFEIRARELPGYSSGASIVS